MNKKNTANTPNPSQDSPLLEVRIEKLLNGGDGLARHESQAIFVPLTAPGDEVRVRVKKKSKNFSIAKVKEILQPGPGRREAPCPHFGHCGGCNLQHIEIDNQRQAKADIVTDCFQRLGKMDITDLLTGPDSAGRDFGYRNRIRVFATGTGPYGMMRRGTNDVVALETCLLMPEQFNTDILPWLRMLPPVEQIVIRLDGAGGWLLSAFGPPTRQKILRKMVGSLAPGEAPAPGCVGLMFNNLPIWGRDHLIHEIAGHKFRVSPRSFFQANHEITEDAVATIRQWITELAEENQLGDLLGDLFCGVGLFSLTLADLFKQVVAIDSDESACRDAINNVKHDPDAKGKVTVCNGDLASVLKDTDLAGPELWKQSFCLADPPRTGLGAEGVKRLLDLSPRHVLFMSCDPATMARDSAQLVEGGYHPVKLKVLDMFPQTSHIETLMLFSKQDGSLD